MATRKRAPAAGPGAARTDPDVAAYMEKLKHPRKPELQALRQLILGVSPEIREGIKWNAPSFRTADWFATTNVHAKDRLRLILHRGAKVKDNSTGRPRIPDPQGLLQWLATDRALVTLGDADDFRAKRAALQAIVRAWVRQL
jgi:hypothetical protein